MLSEASDRERDRDAPVMRRAERGGMSRGPGEGQGVMRTVHPSPMSDNTNRRLLLPEKRSRSLLAAILASFSPIRSRIAAFRASRILAEARDQSRVTFRPYHARAKIREDELQRRASQDRAFSARSGSWRLMRATIRLLIDHRLPLACTLAFARARGPFCFLAGRRKCRLQSSAT